MRKSNVRLEILVRVLADLALLNTSLLFALLPQIVFRHLRLLSLVNVLAACRSSDQRARLRSCFTRWVSIPKGAPTAGNIRRSSSCDQRLCCFRLSHSVCTS